jgi:hypothetical protein
MVGMHDVQYDNVVVFFQRENQAIGAVVCYVDCITRLLKPLLQVSAGLFLVFDDQNSHGCPDKVNALSLG